MPVAVRTIKKMHVFIVYQVPVLVLSTRIESRTWSNCLTFGGKPSFPNPFRLKSERTLGPARSSTGHAPGCTEPANQRDRMHIAVQSRVLASLHRNSRAPEFHRRFWTFVTF